MSNYKAWHWIEKQLVVAWAVIKRIDANSDSNNITLCTEPICVPLLPATDLDYSGDVTYNLSLTEEVVQIFPARHGTMKVEIVRDSLVHPERHSVEGLRHWIGYEHPGTPAVSAPPGRREYRGHHEHTRPASNK